MTASLVKSDPISEEDQVALRKHYDKDLSAVCEQIRELDPVRAIGSSGTLENIAMLCGSEPENNGHAEPKLPVIERSAFDKLLEELIKSDAKKRARWPGSTPAGQIRLSPGRF